MRKKKSSDASDPFGLALDYPHQNFEIFYAVDFPSLADTHTRRILIFY